MITSLVLGASGFIGQHFVNYLKLKGHKVIGVDRYDYTYFNELKKPDEFYVTDLTVYENMQSMLTTDVDEIYHFASETGGVAFSYRGKHDADALVNNLSVTTNLLRVAEEVGIKKIFYCSSASVYPEYILLDTENSICEEHAVYPAQPDSESGWENLIAERIMLAYAKDKDFQIRIARLHNVFGPYTCWNNGRETSPAALCRKIAQAENGGTIDVWGPGNQTRSYLYIEECVEGIFRIMNSDIEEPVNLGSDKSISVNGLALIIAGIANKQITINNKPGPLGPMGRVSCNKFLKRKLDWEPNSEIQKGLEQLYYWVEYQVKQDALDERPI